MNYVLNTEYRALPDGEWCPLLFEKDNPEYGIEKTDDAVALCARTVFGVPSLFPWQRLTIANILDAVSAVSRTNSAAACTDTANDVESAAAKQLSCYSSVERMTDCYDEDGISRGRQIVLLPTGAGKSLCFQVPAVLLACPTLVIYPLLALMGDQLRRMQACGLLPAYFRGGQSREERAAQFARLEGTDGRPPAKLIIANPEILMQETVLKRIAARNIAHLAIDEAHCVSEWGDTFRPAYHALRTVIAVLNPPAVTAFTATAGRGVLTRITDILFDGNAHVVRSESDRPNIMYHVRQCRVKYPALLIEVQYQSRPLVIFCATRGGTEQAASFLRYTLNDDAIRFYHAGLQKTEKIAVEQWFHTHNSAVLVTTCAWGMGVDKKNIRTVIHLDPPLTAESYVQETGRAGRDTLPADVILLWSPEDRKRIDALPEPLRQRGQVLVAFAESGRCRREVLLEALGETRAISHHKGDECISCSGCDICQKNAVLYPNDEHQLLNLLEYYPRQYTVHRLAGLLHNNARCWRVSDVRNLITTLYSEKKIFHAYPLLWQRALSACKTCESGKF